jgi:trimeric autotransporter adhesin
MKNFYKLLLMLFVCCTTTTVYLQTLAPQKWEVVKEKITEIFLGNKNEIPDKKLRTTKKNNRKDVDFLTLNAQKNASKIIKSTTATTLNTTNPPNVFSADKSVTVQGGGNPLPGGQLNYSIFLDNQTASNVTNVVFTDVLNANLTLVAGSVKATPIGANDSYAAIGNVGITINAANGILANDISPDNTALSITPITGTGSNAGAFTIAADGSFTYINNPGFTGAETFTYTVVSTNGTTGTGTITVNVNNTIWFINGAYAGGGNNGTLAKPFTTINAFQTINDGANTNRGEDGDNIFVYSGTYSSTVLSLRSAQKLIGQDATNSITSIIGITAPTFSNALPATSGTTVTIANTTATPITLNTANDVEGCTITTTTATTVFGASVGALKVRGTVLIATAAQALQITAGGVLDVQFKSISATSAAKGFSINNSTGKFEILGVGTTAGSAGTISSITNRGAEFISCTNIIIKNMNFTNANTSATICTSPAVDNSACNAALHLKTVTGVTLDNIVITGTSNSMGINLNNVSGFSLANSTITAAGSTNATGNETGGIYALNLGGTCAITNTNVNDSWGRGFYCYNGILSLNPTVNLTVTGCQFKNSFNRSNGADNFIFNGYGTSNNTVTIKSNDFSNPRASGLQLNFGNASNNTIQVGGTNAPDGNTIIAAAASPGSNGFSLQGVGTAVINYNIYNNNFQSSFNGGLTCNVGAQANCNMQGRIFSNTITHINTGNANGISLAAYNSSTHKTEVNNNTISGTKNYGIVVESNDNTVAASTARMDATVKNNNINMVANSYAHVGAIAVANNAGTNGLKTCINVGNNTTNSPVAGLAAGQFDVLSLLPGNQVILQGASVFSPNAGADKTPSLITFWNANNPGPRTAIDEVGGGSIIAGTCLLPTNAASSRVVALDFSKNEITTTDTEVTLEVDAKNDLEEIAVIDSREAATKITTEPTNFSNTTTGSLSGETITVNGSGTGFTIPVNKTTTITFSATISSAPSTCAITNTASVASNLATFNSNTTTTNLVVPGINAGSTISATSVCSGGSITLTAAAPSGSQLNWFTVPTGGSSISTLNTFSPVNITTPTSYYASATIGGCESVRTLVGSVSINPLPAITVSASAAICEGATSFTIPYTATTATPTTYSISGTGITTVTNAALPATPITVNLSAGASGTSISYTLTVKNANSCVSNNVTGSVTVNPLPTITKSASADICVGATSFTIPYTATTGTPTTYSVSGTGITTVTNAVLPATAITVNLSGGASGTSISYNLTVRNANGCISSNVAGSVNVNPYTLPTGAIVVTQNVSNNTFNNASCNLVTNILPNGGAAVTGNVTAKVWIETTQPVQFVKRHYEINPATNAANATARVTLYFTDAEFNAFNTQTTPPALLLPISTDAPATITARKANLRIEKRAGTGDVNGTLNSYTGAVTTIDPVDADIIWNATASRWEVSFDVIGFSGFWAKTTTGLLPLNLVSFTGTKTSNGNLLEWKTANEINTKAFMIERSYDGINFIGIGNVNALGNGNGNYNFTDADKYNGVVYYRLKMIDNDGRFTNSNIIKLSTFNLQLSTLYPNPIKDKATLYISDRSLLNTQATIVDANGRIIRAFNIKNNFEIVDMSVLPSGLYVLKLSNGEIVKMIKQ